MMRETFNGTAADRSPIGEMANRTGGRGLTPQNCPIRYIDDPPREQATPTAAAPAVIEAPGDPIRIFCNPADLPELARFVDERAGADFFEAVADGPTAVPAGRVSVFLRCPRPDDIEPAETACLFAAPGAVPLADFLKARPPHLRDLAEYLRKICLRLPEYRDWQTGQLRADAAAARHSVAAIAGIVL